MKLNIEVYGVSDQEFINEDGATVSIREMCNQLEHKISASYIKNKVDIQFIDVHKDHYDEEKAKQLLAEGYLLPWIFFNGELEFYNGFSIPMINKEVLKLMSYKMVKKSTNKE